MRDGLQLLAVIFVGVAVRLACLTHPTVLHHASTRLELATPVSSWKALQEGLFLYSQGLDPYDGSIFRQAPLLLYLFQLCPTYLVPFLYTLADTGTAFALIGVAHVKASEQSNQPLQLWWIALISLFNPLGILGTAARSTNTFSHLAIAVSMYGASTGSVVISMIAFSLAMHLSMPLILLPPILLLLSHSRRTDFKSTAREALPCLLLHQAFLLGLSYTLLGSWSFTKTYTAAWTVQDLTPNVGLYWYFFTEMFDHFRKFFLLVFTAHLHIYSIPVCLKLRYDPLLACTVLSGILAIFKSYPTVGDTAFYHSLLALHPELVPHMRHPMLTIMAHLYTILLLPTFHHIWLYAGSGNSNFYYASTLVWALSGGIGVMDTLTAGLKLKLVGEAREKGHGGLKVGQSTLNSDDWSVVRQ